jgi:hypothetical protein
VIVPALSTGSESGTSASRVVEVVAAPRVLGRPVAASDAPSARGEASAASASAATALRYWTEATANSARADSVDVNHLTEHVLRTLDQRLVAARERLSHGTRS